MSSTEIYVLLIESCDTGSYSPVLCIEMRTQLQTCTDIGYAIVSYYRKEVIKYTGTYSLQYGKTCTHIIHYKCIEMH